MVSASSSPRAARVGGATFTSPPRPIGPRGGQSQEPRAKSRELALYDPELAKRPQLVVLNKIDLPDVRKRARQLTQPFARRGIKLHAISAATGEGTAELLEAIWRALPPRT